MDADAVISNIDLHLYPHNAFITFRYLHHVITIHICAFVKCNYYPLFAYKVMSDLDLKVVISASSKYKNALFMVEHYYSNHIC